MSILVTGAAGFIGFHVARQLLSEGIPVAGVDNLNRYYDVELKEARLALLKEKPGFRFEQLELARRDDVEAFFNRTKPRIVIHLAAQAGVRYAKLNPQAYVESNLVGFHNVLECCRQGRIEHLVYASSSSVYGANRAMPYSTSQNVDHPLSFYAATKKANELIAHSYSHLYRIPTTGLRFFSVYGPWGRPDMAYFSFTKAIIEGRTIDVYNEGRMRRDFSCIDDVVKAVVAISRKAPAPNASWDATKPDPATSSAPYRVYNVGNSQPVELMKFITLLEDLIGKKASKRLVAAESDDVIDTFADATELERDFGVRPSTPIAVGLEHFVRWYRSFYKL